MSDDGRQMEGALSGSREPSPAVSALPGVDPARIEGLDEGIAGIVTILRQGGIETFESCEGGPGHAFPEPTVRFYGTLAAGPRALAVCMDHGLPVMALRRVWYMEDNEPTGPRWELTFKAKTDAL